MQVLIERSTNLDILGPGNADIIERGQHNRSSSPESHDSRIATLANP